MRIDSDVLASVSGKDSNKKKYRIFILLLAFKFVMRVFVPELNYLYYFDCNLG